jgi:hypothetical protein
MLVEAQVSSMKTRRVEIKLLLEPLLPSSQDIRPVNAVPRLPMRFPRCAGLGSLREAGAAHAA